MNDKYAAAERFLREEVAALTGQPPETVLPNTVLVGTGRVVDSADLVMLLIAAEEYAKDELGAMFDWTSDSAMSEARSVLRSVSSLAKHLSELPPI
jgi:protein-disulfide isomerase-like protein with CxxC motif